MNRSRISQQWIVTLLFASAWCVFPGCGSGHPKTTHVTGTVTYRGKPVEGANIMFACKTGRPAEAITDAAGHFTLATFREADGAIDGQHTVIVSKVVYLSRVTGKEVTTAEAMKSDDDPRNPKMIPHQVIPLRYTSPSQSPLHVSVTVGGDNDFKFDLTD